MSDDIRQQIARTPTNSHHKRLAADHGLVIDAEFAALCPATSDDESAQLELSLISEGCRDDLIAWKETRAILDGHHRHPLCEKHEIPFGVVLLALANREACQRWILANQLGRRNLSSQAASYLRGTRYLLEKHAHGGDHSNGDASHRSDNLKTSQRLADEYHVGQATILRDGTFARAVETIVSTCGPHAKQLLLARDSLITRRDVLILAAMAAESQVKAIEELVETGKLPRRAATGKKSTITLPTEPKALAAKLVSTLGPEASSNVVNEIKKLLRATKLNGTASGTENGKTRRIDGRRGDNTLFNPEPSATALLATMPNLDSRVRRGQQLTTDNGQGNKQP